MKGSFISETPQVAVSYRGVTAFTGDPLSVCCPETRYPQQGCGKSGESPKHIPRTHGCPWLINTNTEVMGLIFCVFQWESNPVMDKISHDIPWMSSYLLLFIDRKPKGWSAYYHREDFSQKVMKLFLTLPLLLFCNVYKDSVFITEHRSNSETLWK